MSNREHQAGLINNQIILNNIAVESKARRPHESMRNPLQSNNKIEQHRTKSIENFNASNNNSSKIDYNSMIFINSKSKVLDINTENNSAKRILNPSPLGKPLKCDLPKYKKSENFEKIPHIQEQKPPQPAFRSNSQIKPSRQLMQILQNSSESNKQPLSLGLPKENKTSQPKEVPSASLNSNHKPDSSNPSKLKKCLECFINNGITTECPHSFCETCL